MSNVRLTVVTLLLLARFATPAQAQTFDVVDLGTLPGTNASYSHAINDDGVVIGTSGLGTTGSPSRLFAWQQSTGMRDLIAPQTLPNQFLRLNASGQIAGIWQRGGATYPFLWDNGAFRELPQPSANWVKSIDRLTDGGVLMFRGPTPTSGCPSQSSLLYQGALYDVSTVLGNCWDPRDVDDGPSIAGSFRVSGPFASYDAAIWRPSGTELLVSRRPPGGIIIPNTYSRIAPGGIGTGTLGSAASYMFVLGPGNNYVELQSPVGGALFPYGMNRWGEVAANGVGVSTRGYLVRNNRLVDLTSVAAGFNILSVADINNKGHIAALARLPNGEVHAVVIRPTDAPRLQATTSGNAVTLTWTPSPAAPAGVTYLLQVGTSAGASNLYNGNVGALTTLGGAVPNGTYFARVTMVYPSGAWSGRSDEVPFSLPAAPPAPTALTFTIAGRTLSLSWTPPAGVSGVQYVVEAGTRAGVSDIFNGNVGPALAITAPVPPGTYYIRVRATTGATPSSPSNEVVVVVP